MMSDPIQVVILLTTLSFLPLMVVAATTFTRFVVVFSMLRLSLGLQQTPPNLVIIALSVFLTVFVMEEPLQQVYDSAIVPYTEKSISSEEAISIASRSLTEFMVTQTKEDDLALFVTLSKTDMPQTIEEVKFTQIIPAFMLSELRTAFKIGFMIFLPFLLVDLVVSSVLMSLGMIMLPPVTISLPIKIMLFVLIDGWNLIVQSLVNSVIS